MGTTSNKKLDHENSRPIYFTSSSLIFFSSFVILMFYLRIPNDLAVIDDFAGKGLDIFYNREILVFIPYAQPNGAGNFPLTVYFFIVIFFTGVGSFAKL